MSKQDLRRIRLVSRHFHDMQGLKPALGGVALALGLSAWQATGSVSVTILAGVTLLVVADTGAKALDRYYSARIGRVVQSQRFQSWWALGFGPAMLMIDEVQYHFGTGMPSFLWLLCSGLPLWIVVDGWPYRTQHLLTVIAFWVLAFSVTPSGGLAQMVPGAWAVSTALIATGLADHFLLLRIIDSKHDDPVSEGAVDHAGIPSP